MDLHMVSSDSTGHGSPHGFWSQHMLYTSTGLWWYYTPQVSTQPSDIAWAMDINMALGCSTDHSHLYDFHR